MGIFGRRARPSDDEHPHDRYRLSFSRLELAIELHDSTFGRLSSRLGAGRSRIEGESFTAAAEARRTILESDVYRMMLVGELSGQDHLLSNWREGDAHRPARISLDGWEAVLEHLGLLPHLETIRVARSTPAVRHPYCNGSRHRRDGSPPEMELRAYSGIIDNALQVEASNAYVLGYRQDAGEVVAELVEGGETARLCERAYEERISEYHRKLQLVQRGLIATTEYLETMTGEIDGLHCRIETEIEDMEREIRWLDLGEGYEDLEHLLDEVHRIDRRLLA